MKAKLILKHRGYNDYFLISRTDNSEALYASLNPDGEFEQKLSKQNCDEIFSIVDVEKLADSIFEKESSNMLHPQYQMRNTFILGFNKAMELNRDKMFTETHLRLAMQFIKDFVDFRVKDEEMVAKYGFSCSELNPDSAQDMFFQHLQQPTEIDVEIEMEDVIQLKKRAGGITNMGKPKLDSEGCLVLTKKLTFKSK